MAPRIPLEVLERIIDDVSEYDDQLSSIRGFRACALVCRSFLPVCRKHIFASVTLNRFCARRRRRPYPPTSDDLNHLLSNSPHLAEYIRKLEYHVNTREFVAERLPWLLSMFKKLDKLQE